FVDYHTHILYSHPISTTSRIPPLSLHDALPIYLAPCYSGSLRGLLPCSEMIQRLAPSNIHATTYLIVVMGVSGSGKSTLAHSLADYYGYCYLDGDDFHSESSRARMASGQPLTDEMRAPWVASICQHLQERARRHQHCLLAFSGLRKAHRNQLRE